MALGPEVMAGPSGCGAHVAHLNDVAGAISVPAAESRVKRGQRPHARRYAHDMRTAPGRALIAATRAALAATLLALFATRLLAAGPPFPPPVANQAVYDPAEAIRAETEAALERRIDEIETRSGAEIVIYAQVKPGISEDENLADAHALMDQWGVGRSGFDDGLVMMLGLDETRLHGRISLYGGAGFLAAYVNESGLKQIIDQRMVPDARRGDLDGALLAGLAAIDADVTAGGRSRLETMRQVNAVLGLVVAPLLLLFVVGLAWRTWRREGDDPEYLDSPSVLMAGPPADMTPPLATVVRQGRATQHSIDTVLMELASRGHISFANLDQVKKVRSDSEPDPETDPAILLNPQPDDPRPLAAPQALAERTMRLLGGADNRLTRSSLWSLNGELRGVRRSLDADALRLGWLAHLPGPAITKWTAIGIGEALLGLGIGFIGLSVPISGLTLVGGALVVGGIVTAGFGQAMSKRTQNGAIVDAMLKAYRRTLQKTLEQARSMTQVVEDETVRLLADTPDKAVVWAFALGLHRQVAEVLERSLADARASGAQPSYYPYWLSTSPSGAGAGFAGGGTAGVMLGSGSGFSGSGIPDFGGMMSALGSIGATPPSSSSSGGGFGGGGGGGGGGASGSF